MKGELRQGAQKLMGENLKFVWDEFSTLSLAVLVMSVIARHSQARPCLELKTRPRFCPVSLSLSMTDANARPSTINVGINGNPPIQQVKKVGLWHLIFIPKINQL
jgi:hypothetical protein